MLFCFFNLFLYCLKRLIAIGLLSCILLSGTEIHQLSALPALFKHYVEHRESNKDLSFMDFLALHYASTADGHEDDHHHHLPFKSHECNHSAQVMAFESLDAPGFVPPARVTGNGTYMEPIYKQENICSIWQPPQA